MHWLLKKVIAAFISWTTLVRGGLGQYTQTKRLLHCGNRGEGQQTKKVCNIRQGFGLSRFVGLSMVLSGEGGKEV